VTTLTVFANSNDGWIQNSSSASYAAALSSAASGGGTASSNGSFAIGGTDFLNGVTYNIHQAFVEFDTSSITAPAVVSSTVLSTWSSFLNNNFDGATVQAYGGAWGGTVEAADYVQPGSLGTLLASKALSGYATSAYTAMTESGSALSSYLNKTGATELVITTDKFQNGTAPSSGSSNELQFFTSENTGTSNDPKLVVTYTIPTGMSPVIIAPSQAVHRASRW
jgi:hypothetical protein